MADISITTLATLVRMTPERLLTQLQEAGVSVSSVDQMISPEQKRQLLLHMQKTRGEKSGGEEKKRKKITLKRKSVGVVKQGKKSVNVEFRTKRTYVKPTADQPEETADIPSESEAEPAVEEGKPTVETAEGVQDKAPEKAPEKSADKSEKTTLSSKKKGKSKEKEWDKNKRDTRRRSHQPSLDQQEESLRPYKSGRRRKRMGKGGAGSKTAVSLEHGFAKPTEPVVHQVLIPESITVADLARKLSVKAAEVIKIMMGMGAMVTINQVLDRDTAILVIEEMGHTAKPMQATFEEDLAVAEEQSDMEAVDRPPVVTIMGHVDHGKTSLLDYIRRTQVTTSEAGGITQHIGAYQVQTDKGTICFLDTPGHEAFTAMRARGAQCTDIVVLVVAADDGVMPQTIEAIQHAKAAKVPIVVAINKMDKPEADPERIKSELSQHGVMAEDWGGEVMFQPISAKTGLNIPELLDRILLQADVLELKAVADGPAKGIVIESRLDKGLGPVATVLVTRGQLQKGDVVLMGREYGKVRAMINDQGNECDVAGPSTPVELLGLSGTATAGDEMVAVKDERKAREIAQFRQGKYREVRLAARRTVQLDGIFDDLKKGQRAVLNVVLKADVQGSLEAITDSLNKIESDIAKVNIIASGVGGITESDINLAIASQAVVVGFNVRADAGARQAASLEGVDLRYYSVIYKLLEEVRSALSGLLSPTREEKIVGLAQVREVFRATKKGTIAGCMISEGYLKKTLPIRVLRNNVVVFEGQLESLRRFKEDVSDVREGNECGIGIKGYNDIQPDDQIETYEIVTIERTI